ncbi:hypothetical protein EDC01DRAFT_626792 [Geopyxis carbonaria]|nr:hypothetical protein EDC01DRAFT_626792 [Geopyxis carbonaria]
MENFVSFRSPKISPQEEYTAATSPITTSNPVGPSLSAIQINSGSALFVNNSPPSRPATAPSTTYASTSQNNQPIPQLSITQPHSQSSPTVPNLFNPAAPEASSLVNEIDSAQKALQMFKDKQLKYKKKDGSVVIVAEAIDNVLGRIRQFTNIGSILVSSDPAIAALAWGAFNLLLQVAGSDVEMSVKVAESMAEILEYIDIYQTYEAAYRYHNVGVGKKAHELIQRLREDIGEFLQRAKELYETPTPSWLLLEIWR